MHPQMIVELFLSCALALPAATDFKPTLSHADLVVIGFAVRMTQSKTMADVLFIKKPWWDWSEVRIKLVNLPYGGFAFIQGRQFHFHKWFIDHGWMHMPFMWRDYHIYKKPMHSGMRVEEAA